MDLARAYVDDLMNFCVSGDVFTNLVVDEPFASLQADRVLRYFTGGKIVIAHRDPRDVYADVVMRKFEFVPRDVDVFTKWYESMQQASRAGSSEVNVLRVNFEDLVCSYDLAVERVRTFLGVPPEDHVRSREFLDPDRSRHNVRLWESFPDVDAIRKIEAALENYCYDGPTS